MKDTVTAENIHSFFWSDQSRQKLKLREHLQFFRGIFSYSTGSVTVSNCQPAVNKATTATSSSHLHEI